jgi:hypothetical protein
LNSAGSVVARHLGRDAGRSALGVGPSLRATLGSVAQFSAFSPVLDPIVFGH